MTEFGYFVSSDSVRRKCMGESITRQKLRALAPIYGFTQIGSLRRLEAHAQRNKGPYILGIEYDDECGYRFFSETCEPVGPIPDTPMQFLLPQGATRVSVEPCDGPVSSRWYVINVSLTRPHRLVPRSHPFITLQAEPGFSGLVIRLVYELGDACYSQEY